jgi:phospholipase/lecithinase/hemolysin
MTLLLAAAVFPTLSWGYQGIAVFGDSLSDQKNLYLLSARRVPADPPYFNGRYSNGPVWPEQLANIAGMPVNNRAISGARANYQNILGPYGGLRSQVDDFVASRPAGLNRELIYIVWAGSNDLLTARSPSDLRARRKSAASNVASAVQALYRAGARTLVVAGLPDLGGIPFARSSRSPVSPSQFTQASKDFNRTLQNKLRNKVPSHMWMDVFSLMRAVVASPAAYGFVNARDACLTTRACTNPNRFLFFDDRHPTTSAHGIIAERFWSAFNTRGGAASPTDYPESPASRLACATTNCLSGFSVENSEPLGRVGNAQTGHKNAPYTTDICDVGDSALRQRAVAQLTQKGLFLRHSRASGNPVRHYLPLGSCFRGNDGKVF